MNKFFYLKMAAGNMRRNKEIYFPYLLASSLMIMVYYIFLLIANNPGMTNVPHSYTLQVIMEIGVWIGAIFSVIFIFYANSFLMKRRKKEFGLYGILGLEKRHVARIMVYETGIAAFCAIGGGLIVGSVFSKLSFLILMKMIHVAQKSRLIIEPESVVQTLILFLIIFILASVFNLFQVSLARPVDLMSSKNKGEREPKGSVVLTLFGAAFMGIGYWIALTIDKRNLAFIPTFVAVFTVMIGTYCLFIAGSIKILRILKRNKKIYYKPDNFISISGLIYRLRQNAVGLASICIICTMILVTLSVTVSFQVGGTDSVKKMNNVDLQVGNIPTKEYETLLVEGVKTLAPKYNINVERCDVYPDKNFNGYYVNGRMISAYGGMSDAVEDYGSALYCKVILMAAEDYERVTGEKAILEENHGILVCGREGLYSEPSIIDQIGQRGELPFYGGKAESDGSAETVMIEETVTVDKILEHSPLIDDKYSQDDAIYLILKDAAAVEKLDNCYVGRDYTRVKIEFDGTQQDREDFIKALKAPLDETGYGASFSSVEEQMESFYIGYGGLVFVGVMLSVLFLLAMVLIIYYKQLSEGIEDRERFQIMMKVGIDERDVRKTISKQVKTIFFAPLIVAVIHTAAAFKLTSNLISSVMYRNYALFGGCTVTVILFVVLVYLAVYGVTAKIYYKMVH